MVGERVDVAPPGLGHIVVPISGGLHPRLYDVAAPRLEKCNPKNQNQAASHTPDAPAEKVLTAACSNGTVS